MAHIKTVGPDDWKFDVPSAYLIKMAQDGLGYNDRRDFIKRAESQEAFNCFAPYLSRIKIASDEEPVHLISHGAYERWGFNRNGDGFDEDTCKNQCHTFEKYARWYRNHKNDDPSKSYGRIVKAAYNEPMKRVELLVALNKSKSAADRNGGLVADRELEKLARGEDLAVSMSCRVPHDVCSWCHNKARTRDEYCTADMCKAGGCKDNLTRLIKVGGDVHHLGVFNPGCSWFDMSDVFRPADRTAYGHRADWLSKSAEDTWHGTAPLGLILDQDLAPHPDMTPELLEQVKVAHGLAQLERSASLVPEAAQRAFTTAMRGPIDFSGCAEKASEFLAALADAHIVLPLREFASFEKRSEWVTAALPRVQGAVSRMINDGTLESSLAKSALHDKVASQRTTSFARMFASEFSLSKQAVERRSVLSALRECDEPKSIVHNKVACDSGPAESLARDYACYTVAALHRIARFDDDLPLTARYVTTQNRVI